MADSDRDLSSPVEDEVNHHGQYMGSTEDNLEYESDPDVDSHDEEELSSTLTGSELSGGLVAPPDLSKTSHDDRVKMIHLRRYLDQLAEQVLQKDYLLQKTREELKKCRSRVEELQQDRENLQAEIQREEEAQNMAVVYRLYSQLERVDVELEAELKLESEIKQRQDNAEYELNQTQVEQGKYLLADAELRKQEEKYERERSDMAGQRLKKEVHYAQQAERRRRSRERADQGAIRERDRKHRLAMAEARRSREKASKFLKQTLNKARELESEEELKSRDEFQRRMDTVMSLKQNITANKENLRALQARDHARVNQQKLSEKQEREAIIQQGGNPDQIMLIQKRKQEFAKEKELFDKEQEENKVEIVGKILREEQRIKKRMLQQPYLWHDGKREKSKRVGAHRKRKLKIFHESGSSSMEYSADVEEDNMKSPEEVENYLAPLSSDEEKPVATGASKTWVPDSDSECEDAANLAQPEFQGLWDQHKPYTVPKQPDHVTRPAAQTKMEQEILDKVLDKHRAGIVRKQVVGGKEFKGVAFYSKPDVIHFKDFDVGKTYRKKVTLTNVSYSVNHCKLIGITEALKDFIHIQFDPPGQMSAGLTCEMVVTFKPMINEDLEGTVDFLALTGPFSVPLRCTTKKCDLSIDTTRVDFGSSVIGETITRHFTLSNNGALSTKFQLHKLSGLRAKSVSKEDSSIGGMESEDERSQPPTSPDAVMESSKTDQSAPKPTSAKQETGEATAEGAEPDQDGEASEKGTEEDSAKDGHGDSMSVGEGPGDGEDLEDLDGLSVGQIKSGVIGPFSSVRLEIVWQPSIPGQVGSEFVLVFDDPNSARLELTAVASAIDVPVWVERQDIDLKICMLDRLYQDTITVHNRASTALKLKFEVCKELRNHIELLPKTGYIQANSTFNAQLKFLPRSSLFEDGGAYFDTNTGVLEAPMTIIVADQTRPVPFTVHAVVTNSDLSFDVDHIDFGHATIYESVKRTIKLTNQSILPQKYGFMGLPQYVEVQPNDGFGTLLPMETVELDVVFSPPKATNYNFELTCKSLINREFKITCAGVGVHTPLKMSSDVIHFKATSINDVSMATVHVINDHVSMNEFTHPVPRIGKGEICPVGATSFEFIVPDDAPITLSPCVGTVMPGKKTRIHVRFSPTLGSQSIKQEAVEVIKRNIERRRQEEERQRLLREEEARKEEEKREAAKAKGAKPASKGKEKPSKASPTKKAEPEAVLQVSISGFDEADVPEWENIDPQSDEYSQAQSTLLRHYQSQLSTYVIPCYVASGQCAKPGQLKYSPHNTLYLVVHCPSIRPELNVISDSGRHVTDFGEVSRGQSVIKSVTVQNISRETLNLTASILDTGGPFLVLNSFRPLEPDSTHTILVSFTPDESKKFYEVLEVQTGSTTLYLTLKGRGVFPRVALNVDKVLDMGAVITGEFVERTFSIGNSSSLAIEYAIKLDSMSLLRHAQAQELPEFVQRTANKKRHLVGTQNSSGRAVFDCIPAQGTIKPGENREILITFAPDHDSDFYSDGVRLELFNQEETHFFKIIGQAKPHIMYMCGGDDLKSGYESLAVLPVSAEEQEGKPPPGVLLLNLYSRIDGDTYSTAEGEVYAGCVRTMAVSQKKNGEFSCENPAAIMAKGFNVEPQKGQVEAGTKKPIVFTWTPPPKQDPNQVVQSQILFTVKGDVTETYLVMLRGHVVIDDTVHRKKNDVIVADASDPEVVRTKADVGGAQSTTTPAGTSQTPGVTSQSPGHRPVTPVVVPP